MWWTDTYKVKAIPEDAPLPEAVPFPAFSWYREGRRWVVEVPPEYWPFPFEEVVGRFRQPVEKGIEAL